MQLIPKSNVKLKFGDYCFVNRNDDQSALFIYICPRQDSRSYFYGALSTELIAHPDANLIPSKLSLGDHALVHIKCYKECNLHVVGNLADKLSAKILSEIENKIRNMSVGAKHRVWGYKSVLEKANEIAS